MLFTWYQIFWLFTVYAFLGWCTEVAFQAVCHGKIVNRGFLNGPVCPIYGVGMVGVLLLLEPYSGNIFWLFIGGMFLTTAIELIGGWILDAAFHMRWWDYTDEPFNYHGYICLRFSFIWGLAVVGVIKILQPLVITLINIFPHTLGLILLVAVAVCFTADFTVTLRSVIGLRKNLGEMEKIAGRLHNMSDDLTDIVSASALKADSELKELKVKTEEQKAKTREAILVKQKELDKKVNINLKQLNEKIEQAKSEIGVSKSFEDRIENQIEKVSEKYKDAAVEKQINLLKTKELEEKYNQIYADIKKSFGRRRILKAYPKLHRSENQISLLHEMTGLKIKILQLKAESKKVHENRQNKD
ncbi:MAG: putative ABC transporter permease [Bacillota bacterium]